MDGQAPDPARTETLARELVDLLRGQISQVDFWRQPQAQQTLRTQIVRWLDDQDVVAYEQLSSYADIIMEMARRHHTRLAEP